jgi:hypothetical protein
LAYAGQGRDTDVRRHLDTATAQGLAGRTLAELVALSGACTELGDGLAADRLYQVLCPGRTITLATGHIYLGAADHHLAILTATAGRWQQSVRHLRAALAVHGRLGVRP